MVDFKVRHRVLAAAAVIADTTALLVLHPRWGRLGEGLTRPRQWTDQEGPDRVVADLATAALWCFAVWLALGITATVLAATPGRAGALGRAITGRLMPRAFAHILAGAIGLSVLLAPVAADAATLPSPAVSSSSAPAPGWPTDTGTPTTGTPTKASAPIPSPTPSPDPPPTDPTPAASADTVTVAPGDSLWLIEVPPGP